MLRVLALAKKIWTKNIGSNIITMIIICLACYLSSVLFNQFYREYRDYLYFKDTPLGKSVLFMGQEAMHDPDPDAFFQKVNTEYMENMIRYSENSGIVKGVSHMMSFRTDNMEGRIIVYDEITASYLKDSLKLKGNWLFEKEENEFVSIAVYNGDYNIGDIVDLDIYAYTAFQPVDRTIPDKIISVKCIVTGIVKDFDSYCFRLGAIKGNGAYTIGNMFGSYVTADRPTFFFPYSEEFFHDYAFADDNALFYFTDSASENEMEEFYEYAKETGYSVLGSDIIAATKDAADSQFERHFFLFYLTLGLTVIAIICVSFLNIKKISRDFAVYYLNGCSFLKSVAIYYAYFVSMYLVSFIIFLAIAYVQSAVIASSSTVTEEAYSVSRMFSAEINIALTAPAAGFAISLISTVITFIAMKNKRPVQILKES